MDCQPVAAKKHIDIFRLDEPLQVPTASGMDYGRASNDEDLSPGLLRGPHRPSDAVDEEALRLLGRDRASHELKNILVPRPLEGGHAGAGRAADDEIPFSDVGHRDTPGPCGPGIDHDPTVHLDILHRLPPPLIPHGGGEIRRGVEISGEDAVLTRADELNLAQGE